MKEDGTVWTWGQNNAGQLGNGDKTMASARRPCKRRF
ncbi:RCC1 domain-containing protein [Cohnella faecalis]